MKRCLGDVSYRLERCHGSQPIRPRFTKASWYLYLLKINIIPCFAAKPKRPPNDPHKEFSKHHQGALCTTHMTQTPPNLKMGTRLLPQPPPLLFHSKVVTHAAPPSISIAPSVWPSKEPTHTRTPAMHPLGPCLEIRSRPRPGSRLRRTAQAIPPSVNLRAVSRPLGLRSRRSCKGGCAYWPLDRDGPGMRCGVVLG